jgi:hypothetical protein
MERHSVEAAIIPHRRHSQGRWSKHLTSGGRAVLSFSAFREEPMKIRILIPPVAATLVAPDRF